MSLFDVELAAGDLTGARGHLGRALALEGGHTLCYARTELLTRTALLELEHGRLEEAGQRAATVLERCAARREVRGTLNALMLLIDVSVRRGASEEAHRWVQTARDLCEMSGTALHRLALNQRERTLEELELSPSPAPAQSADTVR
jgi:hypothetical protein